jgi:ABC-type lipoprotein release transport system permease subunit
MEFEDTLNWASKERSYIKDDKICFSNKTFFLTVGGISVAVVLLIIYLTSKSSSKEELIEEIIEVIEQ